MTTTHVRVDVPLALAFTVRTVLVEDFRPLRTSEVETTADETQKRALCCLFLLWQYKELLEVASAIMEHEPVMAWTVAYNAGHQLNPLEINYWSQADQIARRLQPGPFPDTPFLLMDLFCEHYDCYRALGGNPLAIASNANEVLRNQFAAALLVVDKGLRKVLPSLNQIYDAGNISAALHVTESLGYTCTQEMIQNFISERSGKF
jgi:hypothetical protein